MIKIYIKGERENQARKKREEGAKLREVRIAERKISSIFNFFYFLRWNEIKGKKFLGIISFGI